MSKVGECPICKKRYSQSVGYCPQCQVGIVPKFDETRGRKPLLQRLARDGIVPAFNETLKEKTSTFVEVYRTENVHLAGLIKEVLEDHEILCYLHNYYSHSLNVHLFFPLAYQGIRVMVYEQDTEEAKEILNLFFKED